MIMFNVGERFHQGEKKSDMESSDCVGVAASIII